MSESTSGGFDSLGGRVALVTGAGGGIGRVAARRFATVGAHLVLADLREEPLRESAAGLPSDTLAWAGDLTDESAVLDLFGQLRERFGRLDIAVNTAGVLRNTPFTEISKGEWDRVVDGNAGTTFLVCRESVKLMRENHWGRIVNFSSVAGQVGGILAGAHYAAGKAAVISLTRSVAKLYAVDGIRCNAIAPCGVETEMLREFTEEQRKTLCAGIPLGRFGTAEEMAELVLWLCSPAADFLTGQTINANGGVYFG
jgi:3-oxoacyl-[acyl-carrier protein] reductase